MINNFSDFVSLLEKKFESSPTFLDRLKMIKYRSEIADRLYISLSENEDFEKDLFANFLDGTENPGDVSYLPDTRSGDDPYSQVRARSRTSTTIGRLIRAILRDNEMKEIFNGIEITDSKIEKFTNLYKSTYVPEGYKFIIVEGRKIAKYYQTENYKYKYSGTLGNSCMNDEDYFKIYSENPEVCKMIALLDSDNLLLGRSILWKLSKTPVEGVNWFMDRVYTAYDEDVERFYTFADANNFIIKTYNSYMRDEGLKFIYKGRGYSGKATVELTRGNFRKYPYLDTMKFLNKDKDKLSNVGYKGGWVLDSTDGSRDRCDYCDGGGCEECTGLLDNN
jgi:hypothetical protein